MKAKKAADHAFPQRIKPDAPFDLNAEVAEAYRLWPELKGNTYFIDAANNCLVHPHATKKMTDRVMKHPLVQKKLKQCKRASRSQYYKAERMPFNVAYLYLKPGSSTLKACPGEYSEAQSSRAIFDHELGHALTLRTKTDAARYGRKDLLAETMADTFSLMRQFQRYGNDNRAIHEKKLIGLGAMMFVFGDEDQQRYFASPAMEQAVSIRDKFNYARFTPKETVFVARGLAVKYTLPEEKLITLKEELTDYRDILHGSARRIVATKSDEAFKWGAAAIRYAMCEDFKYQANARKFREKFWPGIKKEISRRERRVKNAKPRI